MRILPIASQNAVSSYERTNGRSSAVLFPAFGNDQVDISGNATSFSAAMRRITEELQERSPQEQAHIKQIAREVRNGNYHISAQDISTKILQGTRLDAEA